MAVPVNFRGRDGHRAVEKNGERPHRLVPEHLAQQQDQQRCAVQFIRAMTALKHSAVHQHAGGLRLNQICRAGYFAAGCAERGDFHC